MYPAYDYVKNINDTEIEIDVPLQSVLNKLAERLCDSVTLDVEWRTLEWTWSYAMSDYREWSTVIYRLQSLFVSSFIFWGENF